MLAIVIVGAFAIIAAEKPAAAINSEAASSCAANQFASSESLAGVLTCSLVNWANSITAFPSACAANGFVSQVAATLTCTTSDLIQGARTISGYAKTLLNSTSIGWDFRTGSNTILAKLLSQSCAANQFVNVVADTIGCATPSGDVASSPAACNAGDWLTRVIEDGLGALTLTCATVNQEAASSPTACGAGNALTQVTESAAGILSLVCSAFVSSANALTGAVTWAATSPLTVATAGQTITYACPTCISSGNYVHVDADIPLATTTPTIVQNTFATFTTGTSGSKAFGSSLTKNNLVIVCEGQSGTIVLPTAPTDTLTLSYTSVASSAVTGSLTAVQCWNAMSKGGGADTVTSGTYGITCSSINVCTLFINEISGSDTVMTLSTTGGTATTSTSLVMTSVSYTNKPLLLGFYMKATAGTDTAGTGFALLNGETGSLKYLTESNTNPTSSSSSTCPATAGTTTTYDGVCVLLQKATTIFSIALNANTNYVFNAKLRSGSPTGTEALWLHSMGESGITLQLVCMVLSSAGDGGGTVNNNACFTATDTTLFTSALGLGAVPLELWGTVKVGGTATTLLIESGSLTAATNDVTTYKAGSFIGVFPTT